MAKQEIWGVPVGAPELAGLDPEELEQIQHDISEKQREEARRQREKINNILGLTPRREGVLS